MKRRVTFLGEQFRYLFKTYPQRHSWRHKLYILVEAIKLPIQYLRFIRAIRQPVAYSTSRKHECTVILLSHNRPQNMQFMVESALRNEVIRKLVVSNSNPGVDITEWIQFTDPRLTLINETRPTRPGYRFVLAQQAPGNYFLSIDDDILLTPPQWAELFQNLVEDEAVPHGLTGNLYRPGSASSNGSPFHHVSGVDAEVDVLIGAYAFTRLHVDRLFELAKALNLGDVTNLANGEDILLSLVGERKPKIHGLGRVLNCASTSLEGVALWRTMHGFWDDRVALFERAKAAQMAAAKSWIN